MRLEKAAKYLVHADEGVSDHDPLKGRLSRDVAEGAAYTKEQEMLINRAQAKRAEAVRENQGKVTSSLGFMSLAAGDSALRGGYDDARANNRVFDYSFSDIASDAVSRRENVISGVSGSAKAVSGSFGAAGSLGLATTMELGSLGTATPALGVLAYTGYESYNYAAEGTNQLFETHQYREGQAVEDSFRSGNNSSYLGEKASSLTTDIAIATGAGKIFRAATKLEGAIASSYAKLRAHPATTGSTTAKAELASGKGNNGPGVNNVQNYGVNYKNYTTTEWKAPAGTKQTYKIHQMKDIDWGHVRTRGPAKFIGKTNLEAAKAGLTPQLIDEKFVNLHHIGQNSKGPLVEVSTKLHNKKNKQSFRALHGQHGVNKGHPENPVDHGSKWKTDVKNYWKWRAKNVE